MDFLAVIGIVSSLLGIYSFLKNDASLFNKIRSFISYYSFLSLTKDILITIFRDRYTNSVDIKKNLISGAFTI